METIERPFSDLLRDPNSVVSDLDGGDVILRRRDAPALRLSLAATQQQRADAYAVIGRTLRNLAVHAPVALGEALLDEFPWTSLLPKADRTAFVKEFARTCVTTAEIDNFAPLGQLINEWRATAEIHADPDLSRSLRRSTSATGKKVPRPRR